MNKQFPSLFGKTTKINNVKYQATNQLNYHIIFETEKYGLVHFYAVVDQDGNVRI